jgi:hypothetical protein
MENNGIHYTFSTNVAGNEEGPAIDQVNSPVQLKSVGVVTSAFLNAGALAHTIKIKISDEDVASIKTFVKSGPIASEEPAFHWPFTDGAAIANNKEDLASPFGEAYDGRSKALKNLREDDLLRCTVLGPE